MNNTLIRLLALAGMCLILAACNEQTKQQRIGIIDEDKVLTENSVAKAAGDHLEKFGLTFEPEIMAMQEEYQKSPDDKELQNRLNQRFTEIRQMFDAEQMRVGDTVNELYRKAQTTVMKTKGLDMLFPSANVLQYDTALDVTELIVAEMNKQSVEFTLPAPAGAPADKESAPATDGAAKEAPAASDAAQQAPADAPESTGAAPAANGKNPEQPAANGAAPAN